MNYKINDILKLKLDSEVKLGMIVGVQKKDNDEETAIYELILSDDFKRIILNYHELIEKIIKD